MHELSVCQNIIDQVSHIAATHQADSVATIYLQIGPLSGVEPDLLLSAFPVACAGTIADHAELVITSMPVRVHCTGCHKDSEVQVNRLVCGNCGHWQTTLLSGDELLLERVELQREH
ncbi:MAG: hydrogenase maturation nickel metallochaperone HypA [Gammaproteobacteria bacterium]|jgi:hydrogenase nickel incorporation protein HypA/HybF